MVTRSRHMFRQMTLPCGLLPQSDDQLPEMGADSAILVQGSTANTLLFSNSAEHSSTTVPPDTYVQLWAAWSRPKIRPVSEVKLGTAVSSLPSRGVPVEEQLRGEVAPHYTPTTAPTSTTRRLP